jgi:dihydropteroate synthase
VGSRLFWRIDLVRTTLVGVLNVTPDSFSDGGRHMALAAAVSGGVAMAAAGAAWIDVGGESTRPGAVPVAEEEERRRVVPVIEGLRRRLPAEVRISVDTYKAGTARAAIEAGATVVNDVSGGLLDPALLREAARGGAAVVIGHLRGSPETMMRDVRFDDVVAEVAAELEARAAAARHAGCGEIWVDPGIGFGKGTAHNLTLLAELPRLRARLGLPMLVGVSRKRFLGDLTGKPPEERAYGTAAAVTAAILGGASAVRVHDVPEMFDVVRVADAICEARERA